MTKEEEAIKILSDSNILFNIQRDTALSIRVAIETVLNMLKEKDKEIKKLKENINYQTLCDFLISSTSDEEEPVWTEKHIEELLENFEVRWKNAYK